MGRKSIDSLKKGDFAGLTALTILNLNRNTLTSLPEGIFAGLAELTELELGQNQLATLPEGVFDGLVTLEFIDLQGNSLTVLRADEFSGLTALDTPQSERSTNWSRFPTEVFSEPDRADWSLIWTRQQSGFARCRGRVLRPDGADNPPAGQQQSGLRSMPGPCSPT